MPYQCCREYSQDSIRKKASGRSKLWFQFTKDRKTGFWLLLWKRLESFNACGSRISKLYSMAVKTRIIQIKTNIRIIQTRLCAWMCHLCLLTERPEHGDGQALDVPCWAEGWWPRRWTKPRRVLKHSLSTWRPTEGKGTLRPRGHHPHLTEGSFI